MSKKPSVEDTPESWEQGLLGCNLKTAKVASPEVKAQIDDMLGLQAISIRLHKELIDKFKLIAKINGVGYQPLMRDALTRFADSEIKMILIKLAEDGRRPQQDSQLPTNGSNDGEHLKAA